MDSIASIFIGSTADIELWENNPTKEGYVAGAVISVGGYLANEKETKMERTETDGYAIEIQNRDGAAPRTGDYLRHLPGDPAGAPALRRRDGGYWAEAAIRYVWENGLVNGSGRTCSARWISPPEGRSLPSYGGRRAARR